MNGVSTDFPERAGEIDKILWSGQELTNRSVPALQINVLRLDTKIVTVNSCEFKYLAIKQLIGAPKKHIQFVNCDFAEGIRIHSAKGIEGLSFTNCNIKGDLIIHHLDGSSDGTKISLQDSVIDGTVRLTSVTCRSFVIEGCAIREFVMDQSEASDVLTLAGGSVIHGRLHINSGTNSRVDIKDTDLLGLSKIALGSCSAISIQDTNIQTIRISPRSATTNYSNIKVDNVSAENVFVEHLRQIKKLAITRSSFSQIVRFRRLTWSLQSKFEINDVRECGRFAFYSPKYLSGHKDERQVDETEFPACLSLKRLEPAQVRFDSDSAEFFEKKSRTTYDVALGSILENYYNSENETSKADTAKYRKMIQLHKWSIKQGRYQKIVPLILFGYLYGYGVRLFNQVISILTIGLLASVMVTVGRNDWTKWFFNDSSDVPISVGLDVLVLIFVGVGGPWLQDTAVSSQGTLAVSIFRTVAFLSLSASIVQKIGRS
ncbi:MAG: hypothetical protein AAFX04_05570 [Pseudomonadota bacterium]